jgi:hypothetical protein
VPIEKYTVESKKTNNGHDENESDGGMTHGPLGRRLAVFLDNRSTVRREEELHEKPSEIGLLVAEKTAVPHHIYCTSPHHANRIAKNLFHRLFHTKYWRYDYSSIALTILQRTRYNPAEQLKRTKSTSCI